jgi:hypothetical protein
MLRQAQHDNEKACKDYVALARRRSRFNCRVCVRRPSAGTPPPRGCITAAGGNRWGKGRFRDGRVGRNGWDWCRRTGRATVTLGAGEVVFFAMAWSVVRRWAFDKYGRVLLEGLPLTLILSLKGRGEQAACAAATSAFAEASSFAKASEDGMADRTAGGKDMMVARWASPPYLQLQTGRPVRGQRPRLQRRGKRVSVGDNRAGLGWAVVVWSARLFVI